MSELTRGPKEDQGPGSTRPLELCWIALYTKPHKEYLVRDLLRQHGLEVYLPEIRVATPRRNRRKKTPFFPQYLFAHLDPTEDALAQVRWTPGLRRVVSTGGQPVRVPAGAISHIQRRLTEMATAPAPAPFKQGERVHIASGPFEGLDGVFDRTLSPHGRVRVFLHWTSRLVAAELDLHDLTPPR